jgi:hypothetical protein
MDSVDTPGATGTTYGLWELEGPVAAPAKAGAAEAAKMAAAPAAATRVTLIVRSPRLVLTRWTLPLADRPEVKIVWASREDPVAAQYSR